MAKITFTLQEITALADYAAVQPSTARTYCVVRDSKHALHVLNPNGRLYRLSLDPKL